MLKNPLLRRPRYASAAAVSAAKLGRTALRGEDGRRKGDEFRQFPY
jgi:hypothetical protein